MNTIYNGLAGFPDKLIDVATDLSVTIGKGLYNVNKFINKKNVDVNNQEKYKYIKATNFLFLNVIGGAFGAVGGKCIASYLGAKLLTTAFLMTGGAATGLVFGTVLSLACIIKSDYTKAMMGR